MKKMTDHQVLEEAIVSEDPRKRLYARLIATGTPETIEKWLNAERSRGTSPADLMFALVHLSTAMVGSIAAYTVRPDGDEMVADLFRVVAAQEVVSHAVAIRAGMAEDPTS